MKNKQREPAVLDQETRDRITTARVELYSNYPFFAHLAQYLIPAASWYVPTAGVTASRKLYFNPEFAKKCNVKDMTFVLAHEVMHFVTATYAREPEGAHPMVWNWATDIAINYLLSHPEHGSGLALPRPEVCKPLFGGEFEKYDNWCAEDIYYDLMKEHKKKCPHCGKGKEQNNGQSKQGQGAEAGKGEKGEQQAGQSTSGDGNSCGCFKGYWWDGTGDALGNPNNDGKLSEADAADWRERTASAAESARQAGQLPGALDQFCTDILQPRKNWRRELRMAASSSLKRRSDWKRVSRRTAGTVRTPGKSPYMPEAIVYIDTSGSMSDEDVRQAITEVAEIIRLAGGKGTLILGDYEVYYCGEVTINGLKSLPVQRGGTSFVPVFEKIEEERLRPSLFIGFSDLEGAFPELPPKYPVIWCRPEGYKSTAPFGRVIDIDLQ